MNRFEFVNKLNGRLYLLSESERRDIIDEYIGHIDLKMQSGKSEADAIKDFGDIDELASEILRAYHIDSSKIQNKTLDVYIKQIFDYFGRVTEKILGFSARQLAHIFVEFVVLLILLNVLRYPVSLCAGVFSQLFSWFPYSIYNFVHHITDLAANLLWLLLAFMFIFQFINKRVIHGDIVPTQTVRTEENQQPADSEKSKSPASHKIQDTAEAIKEKTETAGKTITAAATKTGSIFARAAGKTGHGIASVMGKTGGVMKKLAGSTGDFVINLTVLILKISLFIFLWLPCAAITVAGIVCTVLATVIYFSTGIGFIGICISGVGCCIMGGGFTLWLTQVLTGGKTENA